jgi:hypothetical protein
MVSLCVFLFFYVLNDEILERRMEGSSRDTKGQETNIEKLTSKSKLIEGYPNRKYKIISRVYEANSGE